MHHLCQATNAACHQKRGQRLEAGWCRTHGTGGERQGFGCGIFARSFVANSWIHDASRYPKEESKAAVKEGIDKAAAFLKKHSITSGVNDDPNIISTCIFFRKFISAYTLFIEIYEAFKCL
jgi:hypothetical protein